MTSLMQEQVVLQDFKKDFGTPVYDEYEEEYLQNIHDEPAVETNPSDEKNQDAMQSRKVEAGKDDKYHWR